MISIILQYLEIDTLEKYRKDKISKGAIYNFLTFIFYMIVSIQLIHIMKVHNENDLILMIRLLIT